MRIPIRTDSVELKISCFAGSQNASNSGLCGLSHANLVLIPRFCIEMSGRVVNLRPVRRVIVMSHVVNTSDTKRRL